ncbi:PREDICTED: WD repeat-containing protein 63-like [Amphimedon queenslandica]|uniref:Uncharacterized protein n=1 Tax=Amphimedon queenslandica TaxID=400682 RepID=A0AAN0J576_AMPQE|nr:PREDICTED: WD repeat-containing protein 63-like [Amphimedon queenslandica]|eukprot:XP_019851896.1 PREDICTED: WD repeat-containing protein 63-like [Amphimedon queenslandica]
MIKLTRPLMKFNVSRKRRLFGREIQFSDYSYINNKELYTEVTPVAPGATSQENILEIKRLELEQGTQAIPEVADKIIQSKWSCPVNACTQYEPRTFSEEEQERVWKSEEMQEFMKNVTPRMELCLQQNEIMDIFPDDYLLLSNDDGIVANTTDTNLKEYQSFTDLKFSKDKVVTCIDWHPTIKGLAYLYTVHVHV